LPRRRIFRSLPANARPKPGRPFAALYAALANRSGIAALEFVAMAPLLIVTFGGVTDLGIAIWDHMTTAAAVNAGADYAANKFQQGSLTATGVPAYLANVAGAVAAASRSGATLTTANIVVTWNNSTTGANFGMCYCVPASGVFPGAATACGGACPDQTTAGQFVQIQATYDYTPFSPVDQPFLSGSYTDTALVRVQ
jgi:Flp pilus assembly protein TadG